MTSDAGRPCRPPYKNCHRTGRACALACSAAPSIRRTQGHRLASLVALRRLKLDRVWWLVTPGNPLKDTRRLPSLEDRLAAGGRDGRPSRDRRDGGRGSPRHALHGRRGPCAAKAAARVFTSCGSWEPTTCRTFIAGSTGAALAKAIPIAVVDRPGSTLAQPPTPGQAVSCDRGDLPNRRRTCCPVVDRRPSSSCMGPDRPCRRQPCVVVRVSGSRSADVHRFRRDDRVAGQNGHGTIDLLGHEHPDQLMRERCAPRSSMIRWVPGVPGRSPSGPPMLNCCRHPCIAVPCQVRRANRLTRRLLPRSSSRQSEAPAGHLPRSQPASSCFRAFGGTGAAFVDFDRLNPGEPEAARQSLGSVEIAAEKLTFRSRLHAAERDKHNLHGAGRQPRRRSLGRSAPHIFSRL